MEREEGGSGRGMEGWRRMKDQGEAWRDGVGWRVRERHGGIKRCAWDNMSSIYAATKLALWMKCLLL